MSTALSNANESQPARIGPPPLSVLTGWLDAGHALRVEPWLDALLADPAPEAGVQAVRALSQLGADRNADALALYLGRRHPHHAAAQTAALRVLTYNRGPHACWQGQVRFRLPEDASTADRAERLSLEGYWLATLRDSTRALDRQRQALDLHPEEAWLWVEHSYALARLDETVRAMDAVRHALQLAPGYRPALLQCALLLQQAGRADDVRALLEPALDATDGATYAWLLHAVACDVGDHERALALLDRVERGSPRADLRVQATLAARRADALLILGRRDEAREHAARVPGDGGFYARLADRLGSDPAGPQAPRILLPLAMVQQHWMTCAPATLTALSRYWGREADHLEVAQAICYDGTPQASERTWAESQGFHVRECRLDWGTACALVRAGVPFALATQFVGGGHLQAVVGVDPLRGTLLVRDPSLPLHAEYEAQPLFASQQSAGPRAMVMLPPGEVHRLDGIELPEAPAWDLGHAVLAALQRHDRPAAMAALDALRAIDPDGDVAWRSARSIAGYDGDEPRILEATERLLERYPDDRALQLSRAHSLFEVRGQADGEAWLEALVGRPQPEPLLLVRWAERLAQDARRLPRSLGVLRSALKRDGQCAAAWGELARQLWMSRGVEAALQPARWSSTLAPTDEWVAANYARACRIAGDPAQGLDWLREREQRWGDRSGRPAVTLAEELDALQRDGEAAEVMAAALRRRPADTPLRLTAAERALHGHRLDEADRWLQACAAADAHAPALLRLRALLMETRGELDAALADVREAVAQEPLQLSHHRLLLRLLRRRDGPARALAQWRPLADAHPAHVGLQMLLYEALPDDAQAIDAQLDRLHAHHPGLPWLARERALRAARLLRNDEAVRLAEQALLLAPSAVVSHSVLASCHQQRSGYAAGVPHLQAALRLDIEFEHALLRLLEAPDAASRRAATDFIAAELRTQVLLGDVLLTFQREANHAWPADDVLSLLRELRARWPALWQGPVAEALQLMHLQRLDEALQVLDDAALRFPALARVQVERAEALRLAGRIDEALAANERTLALSPSWNRAVRLQVDLRCYHRRDWPAAEQLLRRALHTRDGWGDADLIALLAWTQDGQGRTSDALATARRSLCMDPTPDWVWSLVGRVCDRLQSPATFDAVIDEVVASRPGDAAAWLVRAERGRDDADALAAAERAIELEPRQRAAWLARFERLRRLGRVDEIADLLQRLPWPAPAPIALRAWSARLLWDRGDHGQALAQLTTLRAEAPHDEALCALLADWHDERGNHAAYREQAEALVAIAPHEARSHAYLGHALIKGGQCLEALAPLQRALALFPGYAFAVRMLAHAARESGNPDAAEPALQAVWPHLPVVDTACTGIELAIAAREPDRARVWLDRLLTLDAFDIERSTAALQRWREAGWQATLKPLQQAHVRQGGGPTGVVVDWLEQRCPPIFGGVAFTVWRALRLQRRATGPHLLRGLLHWLGTRDAVILMGLLLRRHDAALRADGHAWAQVSYWLGVRNEHRALVRWMHDWRQREQPEPYALANLAGSLVMLGRWHELAQVVEAVLARQPRQEDIRLWQLLLLARSGDLGALEHALARCHEWTPLPWMRRPLECLRAHADLVRDRASRETVTRLRRLLAGRGGPPQERVLQRELWRAARQHVPANRLARWLPIG
jgi:cellulose synthase operon protein C